MKSAERLAKAIKEGKNQIGQICITSTNEGYIICHQDDLESVKGGETSGLVSHSATEDAQRISTYTEEGEFRFTKGELSLKSGWCFKLPDAESLLSVLQSFYGAAVSLWFAEQDGVLRVQNLRDKLNRQTGMYRYAGSVSDEGAQYLVNTLCGPANKCVKKILWKISDEVPLQENEISEFPGYLGKKKECIPMLCQEACNFFVSKARIRAKKEFERKPTDT